MSIHNMYAVFTETREFSGILGLEVTVNRHMDVGNFSRRKVNGRSHFVISDDSKEKHLKTC